MEINTNIGLNTMINNLSSKLGRDINESHLPIGIVYFVVKDIFSDIQKIYEETLRTELEQSNELQEKEIVKEKKNK